MHSAGNKDVTEPVPIIYRGIGIREIEEVLQKTRSQTSIAGHIETHIRCNRIESYIKIEATSYDAKTDSSTGDRSRNRMHHCGKCIGFHSLKN